MFTIDIDTRGTGTITGPIIVALSITGIMEPARIYLPVGHLFGVRLLIISVVLTLPEGLIRMNLKGTLLRFKKGS